MAKRSTVVSGEATDAPATPKPRRARNHKKFPRAARFALMLGIPVLLWAGIWLIIDGLF